mgnify:CR=1 FL=1
MLLILPWPLLLLAVLLKYLFSKSRGYGGRPDEPPGQTPLDVLKKAYARGEINREELETKNADGAFICYESRLLRDWIASAGRMQTQKRMSEDDRMRMASDTFYLKSPEQMTAEFANLPEAIGSASEMASRTKSLGHQISSKYAQAGTHESGNSGSSHAQ